MFLARSVTGLSWLPEKYLPLRISYGHYGNSLTDDKKLLVTALCDVSEGVKLLVEKAITLESPNLSIVVSTSWTHTHLYPYPHNLSIAASASWKHLTHIGRLSAARTSSPEPGRAHWSISSGPCLCSQRPFRATFPPQSYAPSGGFQASCWNCCSGPLPAG